MKNIRKAVVYILVALMLSGTALPVYAEELAEIESAPVLASEPTTAPEAEVTPEPEVTAEPEGEPMLLSLEAEPVGDTGVVTLTATEIEKYRNEDGRYILPSGSYKLGTSLALARYLYINSGVTVTLDLAGYTLTAQWEPTHYSITYELDGGAFATIAPGDFTIESETFALPTPTKEGFEFLGWTGTGVEELTETITIYMATGDREYTAHWKKIDHYTVIYSTKGGTKISDKNVTGSDSLPPARACSKRAMTA